jgi:hypothetical protein
MRTRRQDALDRQALSESTLVRALEGDMIRQICRTLGTGRMELWFLAQEKGIWRLGPVLRAAASAGTFRRARARLLFQNLLSPAGKV